MLSLLVLLVSDSLNLSTEANVLCDQRLCCFTTAAWAHLVLSRPSPLALSMPPLCTLYGATRRAAFAFPCLVTFVAVRRLVLLRRWRGGTRPQQKAPCRQCVAVLMLPPPPPWKQEMVGESELGTHSGDRKWLTLFVWLANFGKFPLVWKVRIFAFLSAIGCFMFIRTGKKRSFRRGHCEGGLTPQSDYTYYVL